MKLWSITYHDDDSASGTVYEWFTSKRAALARIAQLKREYAEVDADRMERYRNGEIGVMSSAFFVHDGSPQQCEVPTTRAALAAWLTLWTGNG